MSANYPSFLAPVGRPERDPVRWMGWLGLSIVFAFLGAFLLGGLLAALDASELIEAAGTEALPEGPRRLVDETRLVFLVAASLMMLAVAVLLAARIAFQRRAWTFVTPVRRFRSRLLLAGFLIFSVLVAVSLGVERMLVGERLEAPLFDPSYDLDARLIYLFGGALFLLLAAAAEEIVFRGVFLQLSGAFTRNAAVLMVVNGLLFSAIHLDPSPGAFTARAVAGAVWAWTVLKLGGIEFALGAHLANNLMLTMLVDPFSEGAQVGQDIPWPYLLGDVVVMLITVGLVQAALRSERGRAWIAGPEGLSLPAASEARRDVSAPDGRP